MNIPFKLFDGPNPVIVEIDYALIAGVKDNIVICSVPTFWTDSGYIDDPLIDPYVLIGYKYEVSTNINSGGWQYRWLVTDLEKWYPAYLSRRHRAFRLIPTGAGIVGYQPASLSWEDRSLILAAAKSHKIESC